MRITVKDILEYLAGGMTQEQILEDFPELEPQTSPLASPLPPIGKAISSLPSPHEALLDQNLSRRLIGNCSVKETAAILPARPGHIKDFLAHETKSYLILS